MFVEFSVRPMRQPPLGKDVHGEVEAVDRRANGGGPRSMSASIEGSWEQVMAVIRGCHQAHAEGHPRVGTTIVVVEDNAHGWPRLLHETASPDPAQIAHARQSVRRIPVEIRH